MIVRFVLILLMLYSLAACKDGAITLVSRSKNITCDNDVVVPSPEACGRGGPKSGSPVPNNAQTPSNPKDDAVKDDEDLEDENRDILIQLVGEFDEMQFRATYLHDVTGMQEQP